MAWFAYGYFVRLPGRSIVPAGYDFGTTADSYSVGDSLGVKGDSEAFVIGILKGRAAKMSGGYDVFVLLEQRRVRGKGSSPPPPSDFFQREEGLRYIGGWARLLNWVAHPLGFGFSKGAGFDFLFSLLDRHAQSACLA